MSREKNWPPRVRAREACGHFGARIELEPGRSLHVDVRDGTLVLEEESENGSGTGIYLPIEPGQMAEVMEFVEHLTYCIRL